jgi:nucleoside phosphorylase
MNVTADILIVTANRIEAKAVLDAFGKATSMPAPMFTSGNCTYSDLGSLNDHRVVMVQSEMGSGSLGASQQTVEEAIVTLQPSAIFMIGVAFGVDSGKQKIGDVLVSKQILLYEPQRIGTENGELKLLPRGSRVDASTRLLSLLRAVDARGGTGDPVVTFGLILSGEKLVDNVAFREQLGTLEPEAIGGEMEGAGLYTSCQKKKVDWILVKAICDWADGHKAINKEQNQQLAATNAVALVVKALQSGKITPLQSARQRTAQLSSGNPTTLSKVTITFNGPFETFGSKERSALVTEVSQIVGIDET